MLSKKMFMVTLILFGLLCIGFSYLVSADDTGYKDPANYGAGYNEWVAPENAFSQDDTYSRSSLGSRTDEQDWYDFNDFNLTMSGCPVINGILVELDAWAGASNIDFDVKLSWDSGSSWTSAKNTGALPLSDTDTYIQLGGPTDNWGHTWSKTQLDDDHFIVYIQHKTTAGFGWLDHLRVKVFYNYSIPSSPSCFKGYITENYCNNADFYWIKGTGGDNTTIRASLSGYPTLSTGFLVCDTPYGYNYNISKFILSHSIYYLGIWSYNTTYCSYSSALNDKWVTPCNISITDINNFSHCNISIYYSYSDVTGWTIWTNSSSNVNLIQNIVNATGTHEYIDSFDYMINGDGNWTIWANYTGNCSGGGSCTLKYFNYSDDNITVNISYWGCNNTNTSSYSINEDNWVNIMGFSLDEGELGLMLVFVLFSLSFVVDRDERRHFWKPIMHFIAVPIALATGVFYLGFSVFSVEWWVGIIMFCFSIILGFSGLYYSLNFNQRIK